MNFYMETVCRAFANTTCESASAADLFLMVVCVALSAVALCWIAGRLRDLSVR